MHNFKTIHCHTERRKIKTIKSFKFFLKHQILTTVANPIFKTKIIKIWLNCHDQKFH